MSRKTDQLQNITVWQDDGGRYGISVTSAAGEVWFSLSNMASNNPDRIKLEVWAEEQLCISEQIVQT